MCVSKQAQNKGSGLNVILEEAVRLSSSTCAEKLRFTKKILSQYFSFVITSPVSSGIYCSVDLNTQGLCNWTMPTFLAKASAEFMPLAYISPYFENHPEIGGEVNGQNGALYSNLFLAGTTI